MKSSIFKFPLFLITFLTITSSLFSKTSETSMMNSFFNLISMVSKFSNPGSILYQLAKFKLKNTEEDFDCTLCKNIVTAVRTTINEKYTFDQLIYMIELGCSVASDMEFCQGFIGGYAPTLFKNLLARLTNEQNLCHSLSFCPESEQVEDPYDYAVRLLKDKPKDKKREKIDPSAPQWKMVQMTDLHYDPKYIQNGTVFCGQPLCCRQPASEYARIKSGKFGYVGKCDTSIDTLKSFAKAVADLGPDFIIWTGDNAEHDNWNQSQETVYEATSTIKGALDEAFANVNKTVVVYPSLGNHEAYPNDLWNPNNTDIFKKIADVYKDYFTEDQAYESFSKFGYYTEKHGESNLRIVALNPLVCDTLNFHLLSSDYKEAKDEFKWLEQVLRQAEKDGEYVYILHHFPINGEFFLYECSRRLTALFDRFDYIIRGVFSGHNHFDDIVGIRTYFEPRKIININYIAPSLTTRDVLNPSFRQYLIDSNSKNIIDYEQYRMNMTSSNEKEEGDWYLSYVATELFNVSDLTEAEKMCQVDVEGEYIIKRRADSEEGVKKAHNKKEIIDAQCTINSDSFHEFHVCTEEGMLKINYFYDVMSTISGEWPVDEEESK